MAEAGQGGGMGVFPSEHQCPIAVIARAAARRWREPLPLPLLHWLGRPHGRLLPPVQAPVEHLDLSYRIRLDDEPQVTACRKQVVMSAVHCAARCILLLCQNRKTFMT